MFVKVFAYSERFNPRQVGLESWLKRIKLEHGLLVGGLLALVGLIGDTAVFESWASTGFGEFAALRSVIFWSLWFFLGTQILFSSVFLSMLGVSRGTFLGDKEFRD
jgi:hypothetical protein